MGENLFSHVYQMQRILFGERMGDADEAKLCRDEVYAAIEGNRIPEHLRFLMFKMTNRCNSDCMYCTHAIHSGSNEKKVDVPLEVIKKTIAEAEDMGVTAMSVNGGEPLLREDIGEIIRYSQNCHITPVLMTNGLLLPEKWKELGDSGLNYMIISFDSLDKENYEKQRGADYETALAGIEAAVRMREVYGNVNIHVTTVLTRENQNILPELIQYMSERKIYVQISPYHHYDPHMEDTLSVRDEKELRNLVEYLLFMKERGALIANSKGFLEHLPAFFLQKKRIPEEYKCLIGYTNLFVDTYMNVRPCWASCFESLGNLAHTSLREMWNGEKMQEYRRRMLRGECEGCWYLCTGEVTMFLENKL